MKLLLQRMSAVIALAASVLFITSCEKSSISSDLVGNDISSANSKEYRYPIYNLSGTQIGIFRIESTEKGNAAVIIQLNNPPGSTLSASIHNPQRNESDPLYIKLNDVNAQGYSRTDEVADETRVLTPEQLANLIGFELRLRKGTQLFAQGSIR